MLAAHRFFPFLFAAALIAVAAPAAAQVSNGVVKIGVLNDQTGLYADLGGPGSVLAAQMAAEDMGGKVIGAPVEVVFADHQNKADVGGRLTVFLGPSFGPAAAGEAVAFAIIIYGALEGFFAGYLATRLYLTAAFERHDPQGVGGSASSSP